MLSVDDAGERDDKILAVPIGDPYRAHIQKFDDLPQKEREDIQYFLEHYKDFDGLNLTFATLEGVLKHSYPYQKSFLDGLDKRFALDKHPSLEAMVVDHADEIAYTSHDIDDGVKYGLIGFEDLLENTLCQQVDIMVDKEGVKRGEKLYRLV